MCKKNIAEHGRTIMPHVPGREVVDVNENCWNSECNCANAAPKRICSLTPSCRMRHNNTYIPSLVKLNGQTPKARPENAGAETDRRLQPSPRRDFRRSLQRESVLRPPRPSSGPLRDAKAPPRTRGFDRRGGLGFRSFPPDLLPGPSRIRTLWPERSVAQAAGAQARTQALGRGARTYTELEGFRAGPNDHGLYQGCSAEVRRQRSSPQPGTGAGEQKKTAQANLRLPVPEGTAEAYEELRHQVLQPHGRIRSLEGRGVLMRCGLAAWAQVRAAALPAQPPESRTPAAGELPVPAALGGELVKLLAGLILSTRQEGIRRV